MGFGSLDRRIVIEQGTESVGTNGERTVSWSTFHTCWAGIDYDGGDEGYEADQLTATNMRSFKIRFYDGITEKMRINYGSAYYDIVHIEELGRERFLVLKGEKKD